MNRMYQCKLVEKGYIKENFFRSGESAIEVLKVLRSFNYGSGIWHIYYNDELEASGSA